MSVILLLLLSGGFYIGFKLGHKFATLKSLSDEAVSRVKAWLK